MDLLSKSVEQFRILIEAPPSLCYTSISRIYFFPQIYCAYDFNILGADCIKVNFSYNSTFQVT